MTLRQLVWMVEFRRREEWERTAAIIANVINAHAGKVVCQPWQVNPYGEAPPAPPVDRTDDITVLDEFFFGD